MAYSIYKIQDTIRVPPENFKMDLSEAVLKIIQENYEGIVDEDLGVLIAATGVDNVGEGRVIPGDGAAWYECTFNILAFKPEMQEIMDGEVSEVTEFGAFVRTGPVEGLVHVSQIMDDYITYDPKSIQFVGRDTGRKVQVADEVLARVVTISLKGSTSKSKIGLTMRQFGLGKNEWRLKPIVKKERGSGSFEKIGKTVKQEADRRVKKK